MEIYGKYFPWSVRRDQAHGVHLHFWHKSRQPVFSMFCSMGKRRRTRAGRRKLPYSQVRKKPGNPDFSAALCVYFNAACGIRTRG